MIIDQDMQDRVAVLLMRNNILKENKSGSINNSWLTQLKLPTSYLKEIHDLDEVFTKYPMMRLENMLPDVAKAVTQAVTQ